MEALDPPSEAQIQRSSTPPETPHFALVERYLHLTRTVAPTLPRTTKRQWPVRNDNCFQRIVLETICGGVWYDYIARPVYQHLSETQAMDAVWLCDPIIAGKTDLGMLNQQSLASRGKGRTVNSV